MLGRKRVGHILARPMIFPRIWKDKGIAKNLTLELFPLIVALAIWREKKLRNPEGDRQNNMKAIHGKNKHLAKRLAKLMCVLVSGSVNWGGLVSQWHLEELTKIYQLLKVLLSFLFLIFPTTLFHRFFSFYTLKLLQKHLMTLILKILLILDRQFNSAHFCSFYRYY